MDPRRASTHAARPATLADVAAVAQTSIATASRALNGGGDLRAETRARVARAALELGYERSSARGRPRRVDARLVELVLGSFGTAWTDAVTRGAREAAFRRGYDLALTLERDDPEDDWPERVATRRPTGIVLGVITPTTAQLDRLRALRIPLVLLDPRSDAGGDLPSVGTTDWQGGYDAGMHMAGISPDRYVVVRGAPRFRFGRAREEGFRRALAERRPDAVVDAATAAWGRSDPGDDLVEALRPRSPGERLGVFAVSDDMALAVFRAARIVERRIPDDMAVIGFDDVPGAARADPPLTTVRQPLAAMAGRAVELVHAMHAGYEAHERIELPSTLVVRRSA